MKLAALRSRERALPDLLNYATLVAPGVVLGKDGSLLAGFYYRGPDNDAQTDDERNASAARLNDKFKLLGSGWTVHVDAIRVSAPGYPTHDRLHFGDRITRLIDEERRRQYEREHAHFETIYALTVSYLPPALAQSRLEDMMYHGDGDVAETPASRVLAAFVGQVNEFQDALGDVVTVDPMTAYETTTEAGGAIRRDALVDYLSWCICGVRHPVNLSTRMPFLDGLIGNHALVGGVEPILDDQHLAIVGLSGFPLETHPGMLSVLDALSLEYRWSNRYIYMDTEDARSELNKYRRQWKQKERGFLDQVFNTNRSAVDQDASHMVSETETALADANSQAVAFGYYTSNIILQSTDKSLLASVAKDLVREIRNLGFMARIESVNAVEAWLGALPGHVFYNIRRPILHTMNLTDLLPLSSIWAGRDANPNPMYPTDAPALVYADTAGATTFRLNLHVSDVGHTLIFGPTGSGKSTLLAMLAAQFMKYREATFYGFDKGYSLYALTRAMDRPHFDIAGETSTLAFSPLAAIRTDNDQVWAEDWIRTCAELQLDRKLTPDEKQQIHEVMHRHRETESTTLTEFVSGIQMPDLRQALAHYTLDGSMGALLDADVDGLYHDDFVVFELEHLMNFADEDKLPVLLYIFHQIEKRLQGQPAMIVLDEAWLMLGHPVFREKIREWLKVLRKHNCMVVMATQSLSDAANSGIVDVLTESCATRIFLPNPVAKSETNRRFYEQVGLNSAQIDIVSTAVPKREYYVMSEEGNRLFELSLGGLALAFVAQSGKESKQQLDTCIESNGESWVSSWLHQHGMSTTPPQIDAVAESASL